MSRPVTLVAWEDATKKPPAQQGMDDGLLPVLIEDEDTTFPAWWNNRDWIDWDCSGDHDHKPVRWAEFPTPPGPGALTVEDLRRVAAVASFAIAENGNRCGIQDADGMALLGRLRAALDQLSQGENIGSAAGN